MTYSFRQHEVFVTLANVRVWGCVLNLQLQSCEPHLVSQPAPQSALLLSGHASWLHKTYVICCFPLCLTSLLLLFQVFCCCFWHAIWQAVHAS
jgi:hypothetical protein